MLFAFAFREGFTASVPTIWSTGSCSPSHFEKVSQHNGALDLHMLALFAFAFREGFTAMTDAVEVAFKCCSPSHFEKVSQRVRQNPIPNLGCSPSHFEKVSQPNP